MRSAGRRARVAERSAAARRRKQPETAEATLWPLLRAPAPHGLRRRSKRHSPSLRSQTTTSASAPLHCVPGLRSVCPGCFCGMLVSYRPLAKLRHQSPPKGRGIPIRRRFGFESRTELAPRLVQQRSQSFHCGPGFRSDSKAKAANASRRTEHSQGSKAACRKHTASKQGSQLARAAPANHAAGAAPAPRGRLRSTHHLK